MHCGTAGYLCLFLYNNFFPMAAMVSLWSQYPILSSTKERICRSCPRDMKLDISYLAKMRQSLTFAFYHYVYLKAWRFQQDISHPPDLPPRLYFMLLRNSLIKLQFLFDTNNYTTLNFMSNLFSWKTCLYTFLVQKQLKPGFTNQPRGLAENWILRFKKIKNWEIS